MSIVEIKILNQVFLSDVLTSNPVTLGNFSRLITL